ncbi:MAG: 23S rRNA (guanosine(2251)-2'-O)-methyltransferase RlmB [Bacilli bacterium]|nr:23S rRNA (guanosine(2251)-2'-O)-methyltransferase RlmB [Bacilli bacterium]
MYVFGKNVVESLIQNGRKINKALVYNEFRDKDILNRLNCPIKYYDLNYLDKIVDGNHQGIIVDIDDYEYYDIDDIIKENGFIVMLDHIEDPHNFGAIIRTCEAAGVDGIIIPKDRSVEVNGTVMKTSVGTLDNMKIVSVTNLTQTIKYLKGKGYWITATDMEGTDYTKIDYKGSICIVIGSEGNGVSRLVLENSDFIASIKMCGKVNSLNASVAAGIVVFEALKQRNEI